MKFNLTYDEWENGKHKDFTKFVIEGVNSTINGVYNINKIGNFGNGFWFKTKEAHPEDYEWMSSKLKKGQSVDGWQIFFTRNSIVFQFSYKSNKNFMNKEIVYYPKFNEDSKFYFI